MTEIGKKLNFPQTSQIKDESTQIYARKLTRVLDEMRDWLLQALKQQINIVNNNLGVSDHGDLTGLDDAADHLWAFLVDGTRKFTGHGDGFSNDTGLADADPYAAASEYAIKAYVDALLAYILASPIGSIIYIWEDAEGDKFLQRLIPGYYGQVLVTGGAGQRPFWDWVWEAPGAEGSPSIVFYCVVESQVSVAKVSMNDLIAESAAIDSFIASNLGDSPLSEFSDQDRTLDATAATAKITPDHSEAVDLSGDMTLDIAYVKSWLHEPSVSDSVALSDAVQISIAITPNVYDSIGVTDEVSVTIA